MTSELGRRAVHASGTGIPLLYVLDLLTWRGLQLFLVACTVVAFVLEFLRLVVGLDHAVYDRLTREYEANNVAGYALYMVGMAIAAFAFEPRVAVPAMLMLSIGDPVSGYLGSNDATTAKELGVLGVMFLVCFALAVPFTTAAGQLLAGVAAAAAGALGATVADGLKPVIRGYVIDDNLTIPPVAGLAMTVVFLLLAV
ncbi:dolichol kinase [Halorarum halophilum]|uniref:Dolichol kinase n=1 Tax=Halorarum halophilum TaxID=2743090 RepID=A0A7D5K8T3_9EURY|nr:dolichol kinase [Halobaculum halophilum]QLG28454.1 dolichol kinase [Halobaculum halophilum]